MPRGKPLPPSLLRSAVARRTLPGGLQATSGLPSTWPRAWTCAWATRCGNLQKNNNQRKPSTWCRACLPAPQGPSTHSLLAPTRLRLLSLQVTAVDSSSSTSISVTTADKGTFTAKQVVVAVPLGVMQKGAIQFKPSGLPTANKNALAQLGAGLLNKVRPPASAEGGMKWSVHAHCIASPRMLRCCSPGAALVPLPTLPARSW